MSAFLGGASQVCEADPPLHCSPPPQSGLFGLPQCAFVFFLFAMMGGKKWEALLDITAFDCAEKEKTSIFPVTTTPLLLGKYRDC